MNREKLMAEVKGIYANLAQDETREHYSQPSASTNPEYYYEETLNMVLYEISNGTFDDFRSGQEIIEAVSKNKSKWLSQWNNSMEG